MIVVLPMTSDGELAELLMQRQRLMFLLATLSILYPVVDGKSAVGN